MTAIKRTYNTVINWVNSQLFLQKLNNPLGFILLTIVSLILAYIFSNFPFKYRILLAGGIVGIPVVIGALFHQRFAIYVLLSISVLVEFFRKYDIPAGTALDGLLMVALFGVLVAQIKNPKKGFSKSPITWAIWIWVAYNLLQVLNPWAGSKLAWVYTVRSMGLLIMFYFIGCYAIDNLKQVRNLIKFIIGLAFFSALYGLKQEWIGFSDKEMQWLYADPDRFQRIFQWSRLRIFSFFSDPTTYGIYMGYVGTICFVLLSGPFSWGKKMLLAIAGSAMFLAMAYAGSRTPFILVPFGFIVFVLLNLKKNVLIVMGIFFVLGAAFMLKSSSNAVIFRIQSAFDPTKSDDTMKVRLDNQAMIQPFIHKHPFGAGLGSTGMWGKRFTPESFLADFAHDSGFVRIAVEMGWVGLLLYAMMLMIILRQTVYYYLRVRNPEIKTYYLILAVFFFILTLASYPQEAITLLPNSLIFYIFMAMSVRLKDFDADWQIEQEKKNNSEKFIGEDAIKNLSSITKLG